MHYAFKIRFVYQGQAVEDGQNRHLSPALQHCHMDRKQIRWLFRESQICRHETQATVKMSLEMERSMFLWKHGSSRPDLLRLRPRAIGWKAHRYVVSKIVISASMNMVRHLSVFALKQSVNLRKTGMDQQAPYVI